MALAVRITCFLLKRKELSKKDRTRLVCAILDGLHALSLSDIISRRADGMLLINGEPVSYEMAALLRESAKAALESEARKLVSSQVASIAARRGIAEGDHPDKLIFYRAALWWMGQEEEHLSVLAGT